MVKKPNKTSTLKIYVEGGGDSDDLKTECRAAFAKFFEKAGLAGKMPRVVASGTRKDAYENYKQALKEGNAAMLLVDSEEAVRTASKWEHVKQRTGDLWDMPDQGKEDHLYLMVQCMEAWLIADPDTLQDYFGEGFNAKALPAASRRQNVEAISKVEIYEALKKATQRCSQKGQYGKGAHSFKLLKLIDPQKVEKASAHAAQLLGYLRAR